MIQAKHSREEMKTCSQKQIEMHQWEDMLLQIKNSGEPQQNKKVSTIGNYKILKTIGFGAFGVVKLVQSMTTSRKYAMKIYELESHEKDRINKKTLKEFNMVSTLNIRYIPRYYELKLRSNGSDPMEK